MTSVVAAPTDRPRRSPPPSLYGLERCHSDTDASPKYRWSCERLPWNPPVARTVPAILNDKGVDLGIEDDGSAVGLDAPHRVGEVADDVDLMPRARRHGSPLGEVNASGPHPLRH